MQTMMISCREATALTEKHMHVGLTWGERLRWRLHLAMCRICTAYTKQSTFIDAVLAHTTPPEGPPPSVSDEDATRLIDKILKK